MKEVSTELILQVASGNIEAFQNMYDDISSFIYTLSYKILGNFHDAEEVTQDVFVKIYKNIKDFKFKSSFKTWVYRITVNTSLNMANKVNKDKYKKRDYGINLKKEAVRLNRETVFEEESEKLIARMLSILNPDERACMLLRIKEDLSYKEIADTLNININTVRTRLKRGREKLLSFRKKEGDNYELRRN